MKASNVRMPHENLPSSLIWVPDKELSQPKQTQKSQPVKSSRSHCTPSPGGVPTGAFDSGERRTTCHVQRARTLPLGTAYGMGHAATEQAPSPVTWLGVQATPLPSLLGPQCLETQFPSHRNHVQDRETTLCQMLD